MKSQYILSYIPRFEPENIFATSVFEVALLLCSAFVHWPQQAVSELQSAFLPALLFCPWWGPVRLSPQTGPLLAFNRCFPPGDELLISQRLSSIVERTQSEVTKVCIFFRKGNFWHPCILPTFLRNNSNKGTGFLCFLEGLLLSCPTGVHVCSCAPRILPAPSLFFSDIPMSCCLASTGSELSLLPLFRAQDQTCPALGGPGSATVALSPGHFAVWQCREP